MSHEQSDPLSPQFTAPMAFQTLARDTLLPCGTFVELVECCGPCGILAELSPQGRTIPQPVEPWNFHGTQNPVKVLEPDHPAAFAPRTTPQPLQNLVEPWWNGTFVGTLLYQRTTWRNPEPYLNHPGPPRSPRRTWWNPW